MKVTINFCNDDGKCFHCSATAALNHEEIEKMSKIMPFINKYNWKAIDYPSEKR